MEHTPAADSSGAQEQEPHHPVDFPTGKPRVHSSRCSILFPGDEGSAAIEEVGGKAFSLLELCRAGLPVPPGCVLTTAFFASWSASVMATEVWRSMAASGTPIAESGVKALQDHCTGLAFSPLQGEVLASALRRLGTDPGIWAVRSSSPAEDEQEASFAGIYRTEIGVTTNGLEDAIRRVFASSFEGRVLSYHRAHRRDPGPPAMAVIVQKLVPADISGIAFSANPVTNSREEIVINAGWGLGETIVTGRTSPDELVLTRQGSTIVDRKTGAKEIACFARPGGGVRECHGYHSERFCLDGYDPFVLRDLVLKAEEVFGDAVDVEWAGKDGNLMILQARPITTMVPLPEALRTGGGGEPVRMYLDLTLVEHGMQGALSPLGSSWMDGILGCTVESLTGNSCAGRDAICGIAQVTEGRMYLNISNLLWIMHPRMIDLLFGGLDTSSAAIIRDCDPAAWKNPVRPALLRGMTAASLWQSRDLLLHAGRGFLSPEAVSRECRRSEAEFLASLDELELQDLPFSEYCEKAGRLIVWWVKEKTGATLINSECARMTVRRMFAGAPDDIRALADRVDRALPNNRTTGMALSLSRLSLLAGGEIDDDVTMLAERIRQGEMPEEFMKEWTDFMEEYGFRGPREIDPASPGYANDPLLALSQIRTYREADLRGQGPAERFENERRRREEACRLLRDYSRKKGRLQERLFVRMETLLDIFGGTREDHKYYLVMVTARVRRRALAAGEILASRNQIGHANEVFCLSIADIQAALDNPGVRMQPAVAANRTRFGRMNRVSRYPPVIDSSGRIIRPNTDGEDNGAEISGYGVSDGTARGPVRVLHHPTEKEVFPGDILVISASDPGWTPLFLTAGGVILEVGGLLQHGSIIAREYGIPCIVGVTRATERFEDGQWVEMDGGNGIIHRISPEDIPCTE
ncbi:hypothetical protein AZH53_11060 [Methanomicrobiaceae archaeon CYW5]|uniref:PEP/pyruvate-binding domain-containing protein n=1 Tax=Methanovulcanius yangii TaxID=1789227 RepID=UPI0029C9E2BC|nr:PEP/pyruvate-binding domain-containing protein [Methanovulcanius yangii]MBT8508927.1 hypothetical protein [Methanovulcanius yangii]MBT8508941.1 hypothetical protein [Methanovulcanius yangii]